MTDTPDAAWRPARVAFWLAAGASTISAVWSLVEREWLGGATGLGVAASFASLARGLPERSRIGTWITGLLLVFVFALLAIRFARS
jgi:hypothetical protein